jgi:polyisoprenyl-phosphate glycosyltransferase
VIPCYNEAESLPQLMLRCAALLATDPYIEVILVDNGSTDNSRVIMDSMTAQTAGLRIVSVSQNRGYGYGILCGLSAAGGDILGWTHADMQTDPMDVRRGIAIFRQSADSERLFVKGRRFGRSVVDGFFTAGMSAFETLLLGYVLTDINAQPSLFHRSFYERWAEPPNDFSLDLFAYYMARRLNLEIRRFPVLFGKRVFGTSHWNVNWRAKLKFIRRTVDFSVRLRSTYHSRP